MTAVWLTLFWWSLFALCSHALVENNTLRLVQMIFRNGDRSPQALYPKDPNPASIWEDGLGQLTKLGRQQCFAVGKYLRSRYGNFITSSPNEIYVDSLAEDRCLASALTFVASFFAPEPKWKFEQNLEWQPIPVHYLPLQSDKFLNPDSYCPQDTLQEFTFFQSAAYNKLIKENVDMLRRLSNCSGLDLTYEKHAMDFFETIYVEKRYGLKIPDCVTPYYESLKDYSNQLLYTYVDNPITHRLRAGPFLKRLVDNMKKKIKGTSPDMKVYLSVAQYENIIILLQSLKAFGGKFPPYSSSLTFELHEGAKGEHTVRLLHLNTTTPETHIDGPVVIALEGCGEFCPLEHFIELAEPLIPEDWATECEVDEPFD